MTSLLTVFTPVVILAMAGAIIGGLRAFFYAREDRHRGKATANILVGMALASAAAESFVSPTTPLMALLVGLMAGAVGGHAIDTVVGIIPEFVRTLLIGWARKQTGYTSHWGDLHRREGDDRKRDRD